MSNEFFTFNAIFTSNFVKIVIELCNGVINLNAIVFIDFLLANITHDVAILQKF